VSKRFLPVDIGASAEDTTSGYRVLYEQEFIERVDALSEQRSEGLALRLIVEGFPAGPVGPGRWEAQGLTEVPIIGRRWIPGSGGKTRACSAYP
jgi:hypothetical protein